MSVLNLACFTCVNKDYSGFSWWWWKSSLTEKEGLAVSWRHWWLVPREPGWSVFAGGEGECHEVANVAICGSEFHPHAEGWWSSVLGNIYGWISFVFFWTAADGLGDWSSSLAVGAQTVSCRPFDWTPAKCLSSRSVAAVAGRLLVDTLLSNRKAS